MFVLGILLVILAVVGLKFYKLAEDKAATAKKGSKWLLIVGIIFMILGVLVVIPAGNRGVVFNVFTGVQKQPLGEGMHLVVPIINQVTKMPVRTFKETVENMSAGSKDLQEVKTTIALNANLVPEGVAELYQKVGTNYVAKIIDPAIQEAVKRATAEYTAAELITKRGLVKDEMELFLRKVLAENGITVTQVFITNFEFSPSFQAAIEAKQEAQQLAQKAANDLERVKLEQQQEIEKFKADAKKMELQRIQLTPEMIQKLKLEVQMKQAEKWDGKLPNFIAGGNANIPIISDLKDLAK